MSKEEEKVLVLEKYIESKSKQFTLGDASSVTGMPVLETEYAIKDLMKRYDCKLKVTDQGDMIYDFGEGLKRRDSKTFGEHLQTFGRWLWKGFTIFYKIVISVTLVVYFIAFLAIILALIVAALSGGKDNKGGGKAIGGLFELVLRVFISIFQWKTIMGSSTYHRRDRYGYSYKHYEEKESAIRQERKKRGKAVLEEKKSFVASIYDFVFGPPRVELDPLANRQEVASFLKESKGLIATPEIQALAGWERPEADNFMTECLGAYNGKADVSPNGTLYGDFSELIRSQDDTGVAKVVYYWDEYEPEHEITGNSSGRNVAIIGMNVFNLISSLTALLVFAPELGTAGTIFLGWIPFIYSAVFFLIPTVRALMVQPLRRKQRMDNVRKRLMKVIFEEHKRSISLEELTKVANDKRTTEEKLNPKLVNQVMEELIYDLGGEMLVDENDASIQYRFEALDQELTDIEELRKDKRDSRGIGEVIFEA